jgi:hypothetical protein
MALGLCLSLFSSIHSVLWWCTLIKTSTKELKRAHKKFKMLKTKARELVNVNYAAFVIHRHTDMFDVHRGT